MKLLIAMLLLVGIHVSPQAKAANLFFGQGNFSRIDVVDVTSGVTVQSVVTHLGADSMAFGPDGNLYFGQGNFGRIDVIDPAAGTAIRSLVTQLGADSMAFGPDGNLYFGQGTFGRIDVIDPASGVVARSLVTQLGADSMAFSPVPLPQSWILLSSSGFLLLLAPAFQRTSRVGRDGDEVGEGFSRI